METKVVPNVANNQQTRRHIPEAYNGHQQRCANHKLQTKVVLYILSRTCN